MFLQNFIKHRLILLFKKVEWNFDGVKTQDQSEIEKNAMFFLFQWISMYGKERESSLSFYKQEMHQQM